MLQLASLFGVITMNKSNQKQTLVTGGAGFLGSYLCESLLAQGQRVLCTDNFFTGRKANVAHLLDHPDFELLEHDVIIPLDREVGEIYNLACPASPIHYQYDPVQTTKTSVMGALNVLELATRMQARVFQASTSEVYGDPQVHPQPEHYWGHVNPIGVRSCYDEGKRCAETLFFDFHQQHNSKLKLLVFLIPMVRACIRRMVVSSLILLCKPCKANPSRSMAMASRPAPSAIAMIW